MRISLRLQEDSINEFPKLSKTLLYTSNFGISCDKEICANVKHLTFLRVLLITGNMMTYSGVFTPYTAFLELSDFVWVHTGFYMVRICQSANELMNLSHIS